MHDHVSRSFKVHCCTHQIRDHPDMFPLHDVLEPALHFINAQCVTNVKCETGFLWTDSKEREFFGGAGRDRTDDLKLAKLPLSQLSYGPTKMVGLGGLEPPTSRLSSARSNQLSYKPKLSRAAHDKASRAFSRERQPCSARSGTRP